MITFQVWQLKEKSIKLETLFILLIFLLLIISRYLTSRKYLFFFRSKNNKFKSLPRQKIFRRLFSQFIVCKRSKFRKQKNLQPYVLPRSLQSKIGTCQEFMLKLFFMEYFTDKQTHGFFISLILEFSLNKKSSSSWMELSFLEVPIQSIKIYLKLTSLC